MAKPGGISGGATAAQITPKKASTAAKKKKPKATTPGAAADSLAPPRKKPDKLVSPPSTAPSSPDGVDVSGQFPIADLSQLRTLAPSGQVFRLDGGTLDGMRMVTRRIETSNGQPGLQVDFKLAGPARAQMFERLEKAGADFDTMQFFKAEVKTRGEQVVLRESGKKQSASITNWSAHKAPGTDVGEVQSLQLSGDGWSLDFVTEEGPVSLQGQVRLRLFGKDPECTEALQQILKKTGLAAAFAPPTPTSLKRYALMRLLWSVDPAAAKALSNKTRIDSIKPDTIKKALAKAGVSKARMDGVRYEEVAPGHFTVVDDQQVEAMQKAGLRYAYSTVQKPAHVLSILQNGQKSTCARWSEGAFIDGMSSMEDMASGGAQGVFSRLVTENASGEFWNGRTYRLILKPELLGRLDIWGWKDDRFGRSWSLSSENVGVQLVENQQAAYDEDNEIVSPVANGAHYIAAVVADDAHAVTKLKKYLTKNGFTPPGGQSIDDFVRLAKYIEPDLLD